jgi:hypothetical protein
VASGIGIGIGAFAQGFVPAFLQAQQNQLLRENQEKQNALATIKSLTEIADAPANLRGSLFQMFLRAQKLDPSSPHLKDITAVFSRLDDTQAQALKAVALAAGLENPTQFHMELGQSLRDPTKAFSIFSEIGKRQRAEKEQRELGGIAREAEGPTQEVGLPGGPSVLEQELLPTPEQRLQNLERAAAKATQLGTPQSLAFARELRAQADTIRKGREPGNEFEQVGLAMFGKISGYTPGEAKTIRKEIQRQRVEVSAQQGAVAAGLKPIPTETAKQLSELHVLLSQIEDVKRLFKPEFVGPIKGRVAALEEATTGKLSDEEIEMRAIVFDMQDALLRARSGAQINEQEYARLVRFLPDVNRPANVFLVRLRRFQRMLQQTIESKSRFATTTRGELGGAPPAAPVPRPQPQGPGRPIPQPGPRILGIERLD